MLVNAADSEWRITNLGGSDCLQSVKRTDRILRVKPGACQAQVGTGISSSAGLYHLFQISARNFFALFKFDSLRMYLRDMTAYRKSNLDEIATTQDCPEFIVIKMNTRASRLLQPKKQRSAL